MTVEDVSLLKVSSKAICIYMYLRLHAGNREFCFPGQRTMAKELHLSESSVRRGIKELIECGAIDTIQRWRLNGGKSTLEYWLK